MSKKYLAKTLFNVLAVSSLMIVWIIPSVSAEQMGATIKTNAQVTTPAVPDNQIDAAAKHKFTLQNFDLVGAKDIKTQFMYENHDGLFKVKKIHFVNIGNAMVVDILENKHVLGRNDEVTVTVPNVDKIIMRIEPYSLNTSGIFDTEMSSASKAFFFTKGKNGMYLLDTNE